MRVDIWSDIVCPWCYVGKRRFERALTTFSHRDEVEIVHRSFQLYPTSPRGSSLSRREVLKRKYGLTDEQADAMDARMTQTAAAEGLEYHLEDGVTGNTFDAHQLLQMAKAHGRQDALAERLYRAHFTERLSIFDREVLVGLAAEVGLDHEEARRALETDAYADAVRADVEHARALGASGVPFFVIDDRYALSGAQSPDVFVAALTRAGEEAALRPTSA